MHSEKTLRRIIDRALIKTPKLQQKSFSKSKYLIFDGTFLSQRKCILTLMDFQSNAILHGKYGLSESSKHDLFSFFYPLKLNGLEPRSFTVDGNQHVAKVLVQLWPNILIQRCIIHIQRQGLMWCRMNPKRTDAKKLREIFLQIPKITTHQQRDNFIYDFQLWEEKYGSILKSVPEKGWVLSDLKRARSALIYALPNMFHYIDDHSIPKNTNTVEGFFARLKDHYRHHRGLATHKRASYFDWYFSLKTR